MNSENWLNLSKEDSYGYSFAKVRDFLILELLLFGGEFESVIIQLVTIIKTYFSFALKVEIVWTPFST